MGLKDVQLEKTDNAVESPQVVSNGKQKQIYTMEEVAKHNSSKDCWIVVENQVYDATKWLPHHPGGKVIISYAGQDATDVFHALHDHLDKAQKKLPFLQIGVLDKPTVVSPLITEFREMRKKFLDAGLFDASLLYFFNRWLICYILFAISIAIVWNFESLPAMLVSLMICGLGNGQLGFIQHDIGHHSVFKSSKIAYFFQILVINVGMSGSALWWNGRHNRHHAKPNHKGFDLDIRTLPLFAWDKDQATLAPKWLIKYQKYYWFILGPPPLMLFYKIWTAKFTFENKKIEFFASALNHVIWYPFLMHLGGWGVFWYTVVVIIFGSTYMGWVFSLNHYMLPLHKTNSMDWVTQTVLTTQNLHSNWFIEWLTGGLSYQVEHHLFPTMPRHNYPLVHEEVKRLVLKHNLPLRETSFFRAGMQVLETLDNAVKP